ncbi:MAG: NAD-dependent epimerase/dehydratase family protein, partial [Acidimicrobiales bacterium]
MTDGPAVLVTGAAGYVGRLCVAALAKRRDDLSALVALDWTDVDSTDRLDGAAYEQADICDPALDDLMRRHGIDTVVHLAS